MECQGCHLPHDLDQLLNHNRQVVRQDVGTQWQNNSHPRWICSVPCRFRGGHLNTHGVPHPIYQTVNQGGCKSWQAGGLLRSDIDEHPILGIGTPVAGGKLCSRSHEPICRIVREARVWLILATNNTYLSCPFRALCQYPTVGTVCQDVQPTLSVNQTRGDERKCPAHQRRAMRSQLQQFLPNWRPICRRIWKRGRRRKRQQWWLRFQLGLGVYT